MIVNDKSRPTSTKRKPTRAASEPLEIYLKEVERHKLLDKDAEKDLLRRLVAARDAWTAASLWTEKALETLWSDLERWRAGGMAGSSLVPGPPRLKPGQLGPDHFVERLYRVFDRHVSRFASRPFAHVRRRHTKRLVRCILFIGLRPRPLERYREAAIAHHGKSVEARIDKARAEFIELRRPLIEKNLRLVLKVAWGFIPGPMSFDELIQEGNLGLMRATESFNGRFAVRFSTYAYLWIRQSVIRALEEKSRMIRLPVHLTHLMRKLSRDKQEGREAPDLVTFQGKRYRVPQIMANPTVTGSIVSIDQARADDESGLSETIADPESRSPEQTAVQEDIGAYVRTTLGSLPVRQRRVLSLRFGIDCTHSHTLGEIGELLGVSSERIRQIQVDALENLRSGPDADILRELVHD